MVSTILAPLEG